MGLRAFVVGVNTLGLQYATRDAELVGEVLEKYGYEVIKPLPDKSEIRDRFETLIDTAKQADTFIIYFSGHGIAQRRGRLEYLVGDDATKTRNKLNLTELVDIFNECKAKHKLLILDCCHAGEGTEEWWFESSDNYRILTSTTRWENATETDKLQSSFFTHHMVSLLNNPPREMLSDTNNILLSDLRTHLERRIQQHNATSSEPIPMPNLMGNEKHNFVIARILLHESAGGQQAKTVAERRYRELALKACDIVNLANLSGDRTISTKKLELRRLYVPLRVLVEAKPEEGEKIESVLRQIEKKRHHVPHADPSQRFALGERLGQSRRIVMLGDPGAGKSTILRWMTTAYLLRLNGHPDWQKLPDVETLPNENWLPILIRCRDLDEEALGGALEGVLERIFRKLEMTTQEVSFLKEIVEKKVVLGQVLLLIDGLDEIGEAKTRSHFCRQIERIAEANENIIIVVTSRIVGYREMGYRIQSGFEHVTVADLSHEDKDLFARQWCELTTSSDQQVKATDELIDDIHSNDRIERMTSNPMLLTTMALVKRRVGKLPTRRADLFFEGVRVLLTWRTDVDEVLDYHEAEPQLRYIAYAMSDRATQTLREDELLTLLRQMRKEYPNLYAIQKRTPYEFLRTLERRTGILIQAGHTAHEGQVEPVYEFRHLTFQEYLAGMALVKKQFPYCDATQSLARIIAPLAGRLDPVDPSIRRARVTFRPPTNKVPTAFASSPFLNRRHTAVSESWREPLRICVYSCASEVADETLLAILRPQGEEDPMVMTRPRTVLAALCLADEPNISGETATIILEGFIEIVEEDDGTNAQSLLSTAGLELAASRWGEVCQKMLLNAFLKSNDESKMLGLAGLYAKLSEQRRKQSAQLTKAWIDSQLELLQSSNSANKIASALALMEYCYGELQNVDSRILSAVDPLIATISESKHTAFASCWALWWLSNPLLANYRWKPMPIQVKDLSIGFKQPELTAHSVRFVADILDRCEIKNREKVSLLAARLDAENAAVRWALVDALRRIESEEAVTPLVAQLKDEDADVRRAVADALGEIGSEEAVAPLVARLDHEDAALRRAAADALGEIGSEDAVAPLVALLKDEDAAVRRAAAGALGKIGSEDAVAPLVARLDHEEPALRRAAAGALGKIGSEEAIAPLVARLDHEDANVRGVVFDLLGRIGSKEAIALLVARLDDEDANVRQSAADALGRVGSEEAVAPLVARLDDEDANVRRAIAGALGEIGSEDAVAPLVARLDDENTDVRWAVAYALGRIEGEEAVAPLVARLDDEDDDMRWAIVGALGEIGSEQAVTPLVTRLDDEDAAVRWAVAHALKRIRSEETVAPLVARLDDEDANVRRAIAGALGEIGSEEAVAPLVARLDDENANVRRAVVGALERIGGQEALAPLVARLDDEDANVRRAVVDALRRIGSKEAVAPLLARLDDEDANVRWIVGDALKRIGSKEAITLLVARLDDEDANVRRAIAGALGEIGSEDAVAPLVARLDDENANVRRAAVGALERIGGQEAVAPLVARLDDEDANVRRASFACVIKHYGLFDAELDLVIISRDLDGIEPFLDPQANIATKHLKWAAEKLDRPPDEIVARVSAIAEALGLPLLQI